MHDYTSTGMLTTLKRRCITPGADGLYTDENLIDMFNESMQEVIVPLIISMREDYYLTYQDFSITPADNYIDIPDHAIGMKLHAVFLVDAQGTLESIPRLSLNEISNGLITRGYRLEGDDVIITPNDYTGIVRLYYYRRPAHIVSTDDAGQILSINTIAKTITLSYAPNTWSSGLIIDACENTQPYNTEVFNRTVSGVSGYTLAFSDITGFEVGQWVSEHGTSVFAQAPAEAASLLINTTAMSVLQGLNDDKGYKIASIKQEQLISDLKKMLSHRVESSSKVISSAGKSIFDSRKSLPTDWRF